MPNGCYAVNFIVKIWSENSKR